MAKRRKYNPNYEWRSNPEAIQAYNRVRGEAQAYANKSGREVGLEANDIFKSWRWFMLPNAENRCGFELRCEVVRPE